MKKGEVTRQKLVETTAELLRSQGYHATGLAQIVADSGAPRGSLYHYFPGGKDDLSIAALEFASTMWRARIDDAIRDAPDLGNAVEAVCVLLADDLAASDYQHGCPVAAVALEAIATSERIRETVAAHYDAWRDMIVDRVADYGVPRATGRQLALFTLATVEGALLLAKVQRSREPLLVAGATLRMFASQLVPKSRKEAIAATRPASPTRSGARHR
jgi:TetR/AcrR family transcriptional repressor of lmrAB and yxaGH operons